MREIANKYRHLTKEWHASDEGIEWHRQHGIDSWKNREEVEKVCEICNSNYSTKITDQKYCSNKCKSKARLLSGIDNIESTCEFCGEKFIKNKYARPTCCSKTCGLKLSFQKGRVHVYKGERARIIEVECEFCKTPFKKIWNKPATCCSKSCGQRLYFQKNKKH